MNFRFSRFVACVSCVLFTLSGTSLGGASENTVLQKLECGMVDPQPSFSLPSPQQNITILMIGSSSTSGVGAGDRSKAYPARTAFHLKAHNSAPTVRIIAKGIPGEKAKAAAQRLPTAIKDTAPDLLVWQVGTNDALGKIPLHELSTTIQHGLQIAQTHALPVILVDPQFFPRILNNQNYENTVNLISDIGQTHNLPVVKRYQRMKRAVELGEGLITDLMAKDRFHMSALGHECLALDLAATLKAGELFLATTTSDISPARATAQEN